MTERITSAQNQKFKHLLALQEKSRLRRESGLFVVEGERELLHCLEGGFRIRCVFCCPELMRSDNGLNATLEGVQRFDISRELYAKAALRGSTEGIVAEVFAKESRLEDLELGDNPLIAVLESVEKPGNLGAVLRSADACGVDAVIVCDPLTDLYNPNLIRASIGAVFTVPCVACSSSEAINWIKCNNIEILTAQLQDSSLYYDCDMKRPTAIVMGTEATGLSQVWRQAADAHIRLPMLGRLDSLNVSVSAAVLLYEALRQRNSLK